MDTHNIKIAPRKIVANLVLMTMLVTQSFSGLMNLIPVASAASVITPATGGTGISIDTTSAPGGTSAWTALGSIGGPVIAESAVGEISTGIHTLTLPTGWEFNTAQNVTIGLNGLTELSLGASVITPGATTLSFNVTGVSTTTPATLTFSNIQVRPTGTVVGSGNITMTAGAISGVTNGVTSFGALTTKSGVANKLAFSTQPTGTGSTGQTFSTFGVEVQDQFGNVLSTANGNADNTTSIAIAGLISPGGGAINGTVGGTLTKTAVDGVASFNDISYSLAENIYFHATSAGLTAVNSNAVIMSASVLTGSPAFAPVTASTEGTATNDSYAGAAMKNWKVTFNSNVLLQNGDEIIVDFPGTTIANGFTVATDTVALVSGPTGLTINGTPTITAGPNGAKVIISVTASQTLNDAPVVISMNKITNPTTKGSYPVTITTKNTGGAVTRQGPTVTSSGTVVATTADAAASTVSVSSNVVQKTYVTNSTITITAKDQYNNLIAGQAVSARLKAATNYSVGDKLNAVAGVGGTDFGAVDQNINFGSVTDASGTSTATFSADLVGVNPRTIEGVIGGTSLMADGTAITSSNPTINVSNGVSVTTPSAANISADSFSGGTSVALPALVIDESQAGDIGTGTFVIAAPTGYVFDTTSVPDVSVTAGNLAVTTPSAISATGITVTITGLSTAASTLKVGNVTPIKARTTSTGSIVAGDLTKHSSSTATIYGLTNGTTNLGTLTWTVGAYAKMQVVTQHSGTETAGSAFTVTVTPQDQFGNTQTTGAPNGMITFTSNATASHNATSPTILASESLNLTTGAKTTAGTFTLTNAGETPTITAAHAGTSSSGTTSAITVNSAAVSAVTIETLASGTGVVIPVQDVTAGSGIHVYAITRDTYGNFKANAASTWSLTNKTAGVANGDLVADGDNKGAVFTAHLVGTATIHADDGAAHTVDSNVVTTVPAAADHLAYTVQPSGTVQVGTALATQPTVKIYDAYNNIRTSDTTTVTLSAFTDAACTIAATGTLAGTLTEAEVAGVADFTGNGVNYDKIGNLYLKATDGSSTGACSTVISVTPGAIAKFTLSASPSTTTATGSSTITIAGQDTYGNTITSDNTTQFTLSVDSDGVLSTLTGTLTAGIATATLTKPTTGTVHVVAQGSSLAAGSATVVFTDASIIPTVALSGAVIASAMDVTTASGRFASGLQVNTTNASTVTVNGSWVTAGATVTVDTLANATTLGAHTYHVVVTSTTGHTAELTVSYQVNADNVTPVTPTVTLSGAVLASAMDLTTATARLAGGLQVSTTNASTMTVNGASVATGATVTIATTASGTTLGTHTYNVIVTSPTGHTANLTISYQVNADSVTPITPTITLSGATIASAMDATTASGRFVSGLQFNTLSGSTATVNGSGVTISSNVITVAGSEAKTLGAHTYHVVVTSTTGHTAELTVAYQVNADAPADTDAPVFVSSAPSNAATAVSVTAGTGTITYGEALVLNDESKILIQKASDSSSVKSGSATVSSVTLSIPYSTLAYNTSYKMTVQSGALKDAAGNIVTGDREIYFTTQSATAPDITGLTIGTVTNSSAVLTYATDVTPDTKQYRVSTTAYSGTWTTLASSPASLTGLTANTTYFYQVKFVKDGQTVNSVPMSFKTAAASTGLAVTNISRIPHGDVTVGGDYGSGYHFRFGVTANSLTETGAYLKLADWSNGLSTLSASGYAQMAVSANGYDTYAAATGSLVNVTNSYGTLVNIASMDMDETLGGRQFMIDLFYKVPTGAAGAYSTSYGIKTE